MRFHDLGTVADSKDLYAAIGSTIDEMIDGLEQKDGTKIPGTRQDGLERFTLFRLRGCNAQRSAIIIGEKEAVNSVYDKDAIIYCHTHPALPKWETRVPSPTDLMQHLKYNSFDVYGLLAAVTPNSSILTHYMPTRAARLPTEDEWKEAVKDSREVRGQSLLGIPFGQVIAHDRYCATMRDSWRWLADHAPHNKGERITPPETFPDLVTSRWEPDDY